MASYSKSTTAAPPRHQSSMTDIPLGGGAAGVHGEGDVVMIVPIATNVNDKTIETPISTDITTDPSTTIGRQGHLFCGCCCDTRRAVLIIDSVLAVLAVLGIIISAVVPDSWVDTEIDDHWRSYAIGYAFLNLLGACIGVWGALRFRVWMVVVAASWHVLAAFMELIALSLVGVILFGVFAYPHFVLAKEIRKGIMDPATYKQKEEHSCCCV
jgi:hypothetical protein